LSNPGINNTDLSLFKNFSLGGEGKRSLQLRLEMYNVFNHPQFSSFANGLTFNVCGNFNDPTDLTSTCRGFNTFPTASSSAVTLPNGSSLYPVQNVRGTSLTGNQPLGKGVGEYNGLSGTVSGNRIIQLAVKIYF
ncbi:MAG: hypothetical protein J2P21_33130, partial [Chloracidobacterium sp.]|nr:hypothetical protein [Chloracidobacterium sp.]